MSSAIATVGPVRASERVAALDVIRGFALLGIVVMNMPDYGSSFLAHSAPQAEYATSWDSAAEILQDLLFSQKFNTMFGLLFGIGFTIQFARLAQRDSQSALRTYIRRLVVLFGIGIVHACLLWTGDVLHLYALFGLVLLAVRGASDRRLLLAAVLLALVSASAGTIGAWKSTAADEQATSDAARAWQTSNDLAYGQGTFFEAAAEHTREMIYEYTATTADTSGLVSFATQMAAAVLLGMVVGRRRWIQNAPLYPLQLRRMHWAVFGMAVACGSVYMIGIRVVDLQGASLLRVFVSIANMAFRLSVTAFYVVTILRVMQIPAWRARLAPIGSVGRMPLTNYVLQTVIATFIFYGWGLGLWGKLGSALVMVLALSIYAMQVPLSTWWLRRAEYGPLELLWRWLTYGRGRIEPRLIAQDRTG